jgi:capsule polysaccharide export protein KpsE/RkpR
MRCKPISSHSHPRLSHVLQQELERELQEVLRADGEKAQSLLDTLAELEQLQNDQATSTRQLSAATERAQASGLAAFEHY